MTRESAIVIGAGLSGLSTGCFLQMNGYRTRIFEHHTVPGGVAACWKRQGYLIDNGIHFVMGFRPGTKLHELYRQVGADDPEMYIPMGAYGRFIDEATGLFLDITKDLGRVIADFRAISPEDAQYIEVIVSGARGMQGLDMSTVGMEYPPELMGWRQSLQELWQVRSLMKYFSGRYDQKVADFVRPIKHPLLRDIVLNLFLPDVPLGFISMLLAVYADDQAGLIKNGCLDFVLAMERRYKSLGGALQYEATVERIIVQNGRAVGVRLADGTEHRADVVVAACDGYSALFRMLGGKYVPEDVKKYYDTWPRFKPMLTVTYGVNMQFPGVPPFSTVRLKEPLMVAGKPAPRIMVRTMNYSPRFAPKGRTVVQAEFETEWEFWNNLQARDRIAYDTEKRRLASEIIRRLDAIYPGIRDQVEMTDVATPYTTWRYTLNDKGAWEGWLLTSEAFKTRMKRKLPGLDNFYMAGQWVMPGGGVPACLFSGKHVAQIMCKEDGKTFQTSTA